MNHETAVLVLINAMQDVERSPEDIRKEIDTLLQAVNPADREAVLKEATEKHERLAAGMPFDVDSRG